MTQNKATQELKRMLITEETFALADAVMREAFPDSEIRSCAAQKALLQEKEYCLYGYFTEEGNCEAILGMWRFSDFLYLEHLAVSPACRGGGMGRKILEEVQKEGMPMLLEVEPPETEISKRRIGFYERIGFQLNSYSYMQPALQAGQKPIPLLLMTFGEKMDETTFQKRKDILYRHVYKCQDIL